MTDPLPRFGLPQSRAEGTETGPAEEIPEWLVEPKGVEAAPELAEVAEEIEAAPEEEIPEWLVAAAAIEFLEN